MEYLRYILPSPLIFLEFHLYKCHFSLLALLLYSLTLFSFLFSHYTVSLFPLFVFPTHEVLFYKILPALLTGLPHFDLRNFSLSLKHLLLVQSHHNIVVLSLIFLHNLTLFLLILMLFYGTHHIPLKPFHKN